MFFIDRSFAWDELRHASQSLSLFAERRLFELRMPSGKPDKGAQQLADLAERPPPDVVCLVVTDKLDKKASDAPWVRAVEKHGVWVPIWPVETAALPAWLRARARQLHVEIEPAAAQLIVDRVEGNLLAAKQELEKLSLLARRRTHQRRFGVAFGRRQCALRCVPARRSGRRRRRRSALCACFWD